MVSLLTHLSTWIIIGLLAGSFVGFLAKGERKGFGLLTNLGLGLAGALVGGLLFYFLQLFPGLDKIAISLRDIIAAIVGSLLVLFGYWAYRHSKT